MSKGLTSATLSAFLTFTGAAAPKAEDKKNEWCTPFDGRWSA